MNNQIEGLKIRDVSIILLLTAAVLFAASIICSINTSNRYRRIENVTNDYTRTQSDIFSLKSASDFLTSKARQYVMTGEANYAIEYFLEVDFTKRRDKAVSNIKLATSQVGVGAADDIEDALAKSNTLMEYELYAMALVASVNKDPHLPDKIGSYNFSSNDLLLSPEEKKEKAYSLIFGKNYSAQKLSIDTSVANASEDLLGDLEKYKRLCTQEYNRSFNILISLLISAALVFTTFTVALFLMVLKPLKFAINAIKEEQLIPEGTSYELNYLAHTYNIVYEDNATTRLHLRQKAEHDFLTGLLNRAAFTNLKEFYSKSSSGIALLLIDLDYFKSINDTYGHETGDKALKFVSELLRESFRSNDFPVRYGGDEFAVIMTEIAQFQKSVIEYKLNYLNDCLQNKCPDGLPKMSVSVGIAFSQQGFTEDLIEKADMALYQTKKNGRCGFTFA